MLNKIPVNNIVSYKSYSLHSFFDVVTMLCVYKNRSILFPSC